jgi:hypothetical protein
VEAGLGSRSNLAEVMNASWLRSIGGVKMQLDICCAITEEATESVCQMVTARSHRDALTKRSKGPYREERAAREEGHRKKVEGLRNDLDDRRGKGKQGEKEKILLEKLEGGGFITELIGLEKISAAAVKRNETFYDLSEENEGATHRADTVSVERKRKRNVGIVESGGKEVDVLEVCRDLTQEDLDLEKQAEEIEKHKKRKVGGGRSRGVDDWDDDLLNWTAKDWEQYDRYLEEMKTDGEEMTAVRNGGGQGEGEVRGERDGEGKDVGASEEEEEEEGEDENGKKDEEDVVEKGMRENGGMEEGLRGMETMLRNPGQQEIEGRYGGKFNRDIGVWRD